MMSKYVFAGTVFIMFLTFSLCWAQEDKMVIATGAGAGTTAAARDEAINDALRKAVEQSVGVLIGSETLTDNFALVRDKILGRVTGYVKEYRILSEGKKKDTYQVKIRAVVGQKKLKWDLLALRLLQAMKEHPKLMVIISEQIDRRLQEGSSAAVPIEDIFLEKEFDLVDREQLEKMKARDIAACFDDYDKAAAIARNHGAQIVLVGKASANFAERTTLYNTPFVFYNANLRVKAINAETARLIASKSAKGKWGSENKEDAGISALEKAGKKIASELIDRIVKTWHREAYEESPYELIITGIKADELRELQSRLKFAKGVKSVSRRSYRNKVAFIDLRYAGPSLALEEKLLGIKNPRLEIVSTAWNKLELKIKK